MGKTLTFKGTVDEASQLLRRSHHCKDPVCDTHLWRVRHELDVAKAKMKALEEEVRKRGLVPVTGAR